MSKQPLNIIDLRESPYIQISSGSFINSLYETIKKMEAVRDAYLDTLKEKLPDVETSILLMHMAMAELPMSNEMSLLEDILQRAVVVSKRIQFLYRYANSYATVPEDSVIKLTLQQAEELGL